MTLSPVTAGLSAAPVFWTQTVAKAHRFWSTVRLFARPGLDHLSFGGLQSVAWGQSLPSHTACRHHGAQETSVALYCRQYKVKTRQRIEGFPSFDPVCSGLAPALLLQACYGLPKQQANA